MLFTKNLEEYILYSPALISGYACNVLKIVTGFTDCDRIVSHLVALKDGIKEKKYPSGIKVDIILGMTKGSSLTRRKHEKIKETIQRINKTVGMPKVQCFYVFNGQEVHSKVYVWCRGKEPKIAFCGSANYSMNAFYKRRECMSECDAEEAFKYFSSLKNDIVNCLSVEVENKIRFSAAENEEELYENSIENLDFNDFACKEPIDYIKVSLLTKDGKVGYGSGVNWGFRQNGLKRDKDQAYIPYNKKDRKQGFFPERIKPEDKNCPLFKVVTKEIGAFYMRLAQSNNKGIHSADSNAIIGKWIRDKLGVPSGTFITKEMLENYGSTRVLFKKYDDDIYTLEFEPDEG